MPLWRAINRIKRMLSSFIKYPIHFLLQAINLTIWGIVIISLGFLKVLIPIPALQGLINTTTGKMEKAFGVCSVFLINFFNKVDWDIELDQSLSNENWYLLISNHMSWLDIILIMHLSVGRFPPPKFFLKKELIWVPFVGLGAWALDMPFMQRYSRSFLEKNPHLKGKDVEATRKSCSKFRTIPTTVVNFVEGSRCTPEKQQEKNSQFTHLLPPKAGGIAFTLSAMGEQFTHVLDATITYPQNRGNVMHDLLCGNLKQVIIRIEAKPVSSDLVGDYFNDEDFRERFQLWLNETWREKDQKLIALRELKKS